MYGKPDVLLRSGFIATLDKNLIRSKNPDKVFKETNYKVNFPTMTHYSEEVVDLYKAFGHGKMTAVNIELTEALVRVVRKVFGNVSIMDWIKANLNSDALSYTHREFLHNFMKLVLREKCTNVNLNLYMNILSPSSNTTQYDDERYDVIKYSNEELMQRVLSKGKPTETTYGLIQFMLFLNLTFGI